MKYSLTAGTLTKKPRASIGSIISHVLLVIFSLVILFPFLWMIDTALKPDAQVFQFPPSLVPDQIKWSNFISVWTFLPFGNFIVNSLLIGCIGTLLVLVTSSLAAYAFARLKFFGRDSLFLIYLGTLMVPQAVLVIPEFLLIKDLGWINSFQALIIPNAFTAFGTFLLRQYFKTIPLELEEAALMDGASRMRILLSVILPLSRSALGVLGLFTFIGFWNNFLWPLIVVNTTEMATIPLGLQMYQGQHSAAWNYMMAGSAISILPGILLVILLQKYLVEGINLTGGIGGR
ncbi:MAG TPA: carbohydrate ABC transporter permease [Ktedonobacteraceae bacterium]|jgi:multiple sugar transport system permease protein